MTSSAARLGMLGATHMELNDLPDGRVRVVCPFCRLERVYAAGEMPEHFEHASSECPIAQLVGAALEEYRLGCGWEVRG